MTDKTTWATQVRIARQTLKMPDAMANVMGGPSKKEAREILRIDQQKRKGKKVLPLHGHLGYFHGMGKNDVRDIIKKKFIVPAGAKIVVEDAYDKGVYEVEVIVPRRK